MFEIIQLQFEVYEFMNMTSPQRLRTGSSKVKSGKLPGKTLQKPHAVRQVPAAWPSQFKKKHKPGVDPGTWMRTSDFFVHGWFIFIHPWENSTIYKESEKKNYV